MDDPKDSTVPEVTDAEIVETPETSETPKDAPSSDKSTVLLSLEEMIKNNIARLEEVSEELKKQRQMFSDILTNDGVYKGQEDQAKEAISIKTKTKQEILKQPQVRQTAEKIKDLSTEVRDKKRELSDYLLEYKRLTDATEIEDHNGEFRQIALDAKLIKVTSKK